MRSLDLADRFWEKVAVGDPDECWLWKAAQQRGYGAIRLTDSLGRRQQVNAQRVAYVLAYGPIPEGLHVLHACDTPLCCNPRHLVAGSRSENMRQMVVRSRRQARPGGPRLTDRCRERIIADLESGVPVRRIAVRHDVAPVTVRAIRRAAAAAPIAPQAGSNEASA